MSDHGHSSPAYGGHGDEEGHAHDNHSLGKYWAVFAALCVLTGASFFTYSDAWPFHDTPQVGWAFMMAVSCTKAMLVILFFMHVKYEANWKYVLTIPAGFMSIFLLLMLIPDVGMRGKWASEERQLYMAIPRSEQAAAEIEHPETDHATDHATEHSTGHEGPSK